MQVASPDEVVRHRPLVCGHCQQPLEGIAGHVKERRQIHDLPQVRLVLREHQVEEVCCPACQQMSRGSFPAGVEAPVQYGPNLRALSVYLHEYQLVPLGRVSELLCDLYTCHVSEGTLVAWVQQAAERLAPTVAQIADWLSAGAFQHADETGVRKASQTALAACQQHQLSHASGLACEARTTGARRHWHLAAFPGACHARSLGQL